MAIGTAGILAGCGSSTSPSTAPFVVCAPSGLSVPGGQIEALSVQGASCQTAEDVTSAVIGDLGKATGSESGTIDGWKCLTFGRNQATCLRGHGTIYAQYAPS